MSITGAVWGSPAQRLLVPAMALLIWPHFSRDGSSYLLQALAALVLHHLAWPPAPAMGMGWTQALGEVFVLATKAPWLVLVTASILFQGSRT